MNRNGRLSRHTSPELDPVVLVCTIVTIAILAAVAWKLTRQIHPAPGIFCPAPDHPVWAASLHQWLCGDSFTGGVKAR